MTSIDVKPLTEDLAFGARITSVDRETLKDADVRRQIAQVFEDRGLIIFEDIEPSGRMQLELCSLFGPIRHHAMKAVPRVELDEATSLMELNCHPDDADVFEIDGRRLAGWLSWHWDACYTGQIYRGGVLRALDIPPEGGMTGIADGIQLYNAISPELRDQFENLNIVYHANLMMMKQRFGMPKSYRVVNLQQASRDILAQTENAPRAIHPAVWQRKTGEKVLHISPWQAAGIEGHEDAAGDALLEALCQEIYAKMTPYWHKWKPTDMMVWDNWRVMHAASGHDPQYARRVHRATIDGDYGLGRFEEGANTGEVVAAMA